MTAKQGNSEDTRPEERTFRPDRKLEDSAGAKGGDRKRAVDASRTGGGERPETVPEQGPVKLP